MCINLNTEAVLLETKVVFTYLSTLQNSATILSMLALPAKRRLDATSTVFSRSL